jgi:hypothetical protein
LSGRADHPVRVGAGAGYAHGPGTDELLREITVRYLPPEKVPAFIDFARAELGEQVAIYLHPQRWLSADLGPA